MHFYWHSAKDKLDFIFNSMRRCNIQQGHLSVVCWGSSEQSWKELLVNFYSSFEAMDNYYRTITDTTVCRMTRMWSRHTATRYWQSKLHIDTTKIIATSIIMEVNTGYLGLWSHKRKSHTALQKVWICFQQFTGNALLFLVEGKEEREKAASAHKTVADREQKCIVHPERVLWQTTNQGRKPATSQPAENIPSI